ncbi:hypothetical protein KJ657_05060 [Patescibacteria group bacterium]|nr:hypothetical protein [Patescibacteria group bacterium]MBU1016425.1 hypothetical protein [Patescibacteria group bacterium]MBU1684923.1 hypothetical protein [Patescibacteria group bacterium]MBU1939049.1 hypothetical protein [Patescibacteria group bacterium]
MNKIEEFQGHLKVGMSHLHKWEQRFVKWGTPKIPHSIETYHLTAMTIFWCIGVLVFGFMTQYNIHWLWGSSAMIILQYLTDLFDGAVGRHRDTGLVRWGYYADHFLDYMFICCILIGYTFFIPDRYGVMFFLLMVYGGFMVNAFVSFGALNEFRVSYFGFGPTEGRIGFIAANTMLAVFGKTYLAQFLPHILIVASIALIIVVYYTQKKIWVIDMKEKTKGKD